MSTTGIVLGCLLAAGGEVEPAPDVVELANGRSLEGRVVYEDGRKLVLLVKSREREIEQEDVVSVRAALRELPGALDAIAALEPGDLAAHHALAELLDERNLPREARLVDLMVLEFAPQDELANERLGHKKRGESFTLPHSGRWYRLRERERLLEDWGAAWELESTHFRVRSNLSLRAAVAVILDLERTYRAFYEAFGPGLELWDITTPIEAWVHADATSFPETADNARSYFSSVDPRLYVNASRGLRMETLVHEATHAILHHSAVHTRSGRGVIPGWLDEGLAEYMQASYSGERGAAATFACGRPARGHFHEHATSDDPFRLNRVLNFQSDDFQGSSKTTLKYAQSYTLVHFCLHADGGGHRGSFFDFVRGAYAGQGSSTHFKRSMELRERELESAWHAYAAQLGGGRR